MKIFNKNNQSGGPRGNKWSKRRDFGDNRGSRPGMHQAICSECGNKCEVPFRPTGDKPVYCSQCFGKVNKPSAQTPDQFKQQFETLNSKLDKILQALRPAVSLEISKEEKAVKAKKEIKKNRAALKKVKTKK